MNINITNNKILVVTSRTPGQEVRKVCTNHLQTAKWILSCSCGHLLEHSELIDRIDCNVFKILKNVFTPTEKTVYEPFRNVMMKNVFIAFPEQFVKSTIWLHVLKSMSSTHRKNILGALERRTVTSPGVWFQGSKCTWTLIISSSKNVTYTNIQKHYQNVSVETIF